MSEQEVIDLMYSSSSEDNWDRNCDIVKKEFNGYPEFWYRSIILLCVYAYTSSKW